MDMIISPSCYDDVMEKHFRMFKGLGLTDARTKEAFYGFDGEDVLCVHSQLLGRHGVYFRLRDGRVIDTAGREHDPNPIWYDQTTH